MIDPICSVIYTWITLSLP